MVFHHKFSIKVVCLISIIIIIAVMHLWWLNLCCTCFFFSNFLLLLLHLPKMLVDFVSFLFINVTFKVGFCLCLDNFALHSPHSQILPRSCEYCMKLLPQLLHIFISIIVALIHLWAKLCLALYYADVLLLPLTF